MLKLFEEQKESLYKVQKGIGCGIYTLYRYAQGQRSVKNMPAKIVCDLANYFKIEVNDLYDRMVKYQKKMAKEKKKG